MDDKAAMPDPEQRRVEAWAQAQGVPSACQIEWVDGKPLDLFVVEYSVDERGNRYLDLTTRKPATQSRRVTVVEPFPVKLA